MGFVFGPYLGPGIFWLLQFAPNSLDLKEPRSLRRTTCRHGYVYVNSKVGPTLSHDSVLLRECMSVGGLMPMRKFCHSRTTLSLRERVVGFQTTTRYLCRNKCGLYG
ncbi:hypothetical protein ACOSQ2_029228 [Xanthoceras sorbifolium]